MSKDYHNNFVLLDSLNQQDLGAFNFVYITYRKKLLLLAVYILKDEEAAKDLVHEFFLDFWEKRLFEKINSNIGAYLSQSIRNRALNLKKKTDSLLNRLRDDHHETPFLTHYPFENEELRKELTRAINRLPAMCRKVFFLHYVEHLTYSQITEKLGIKNSTVKNHIARALNELRDHLKKN